jgi:mono/diheme cytochrome c family protein
VIRHGIRPNGTSVILAMPSSMLYHLSDEDVGAIIAYLKTQAPGEQGLPDSRVGPLARLFLFYYKQSFGPILAAEQIDHDSPRLPSSIDNPVANGRYLAMTVCSECHGDDLRGGPNGFAPSLALVAAYSLDDFRKLMRTGEAIGNRELGLMVRVAQARFSHFADLEIDRLHAYLQTLAATAEDP